MNGIRLALALMGTFAGVARAVPPQEPLERELAGADLVVGMLGKLTPVEGTRQATGEIAATRG